MDMNQMIAEMQSLKSDPTKKGDAGEELCIEALRPYVAANEGILLHSLRYPVPKKADGTEHAGNLKYDNTEKKIRSTDKGGTDEVDVVLLTTRRIFLIESKSYGNAKLLITNDWFFRNKQPYEKDLFNQTEKHARHFYHMFYEYIPDGDPSYVIPVFCSVDKSEVINRSEDNYPVAVLNNLCKVIGELDKYGKYSVDVEALMEAFRQKGATFTER